MESAATPNTAYWMRAALIDASLGHAPPAALAGCLQSSRFRDVVQAKFVIEAWRRHYNEVRPHSSLGYLTPAEFAAKLEQTNAAPASATGRDAARHGGFAPRPVAKPSSKGQSKEQETPVLSS